MPRFDKHQLPRLTASEIFGPFLHQMLVETSLNIGTNTGI